MDISSKRLLASTMAVVVITSAFAAFSAGGIALAVAPVICPLDEDFSGSWPPGGWATDNWTQNSSNNAGGTSPEAHLYWEYIYDDYAYLDSKPVDTSGATSLTLEFKSFIDDYCCEEGVEEGWCYDSYYYCSVYTRANGGDSWTDVTPWSNPICGNVGPGTYSIDISSDIGSATEVSFEFDGYDSDAIDCWYVDDVRICGEGLAWPDLVVSKSVGFDEYGNFIVSYNVTNQGNVAAGESVIDGYVDGCSFAARGCPALDPGQSHSDAFPAEPLPSPCPCGGTCNVTVCADDWGYVDESDETNNCELNVVECPCPEIVDPKQDSLYVDVDGNGAASPGDILQYIAEIRNEGDATAANVTFSDTVDVNTILLCAAPYAPIASQGSITGCTPGPGGSLAADLGNIAPGGVVTVTLYVRIGHGDFDQVYNQGIVRGDNFADDPTDDPDTLEADDPTYTPISPPGPAPPVPTVSNWGIAAMIGLFAGLLVWRVRTRLST